MSRFCQGNEIIKFADQEVPVANMACFALAFCFWAPTHNEVAPNADFFDVSTELGRANHNAFVVWAKENGLVPDQDKSAEPDAARNIDIDYFIALSQLLLEGHYMRPIDIFHDWVSQPGDRD